MARAKNFYETQIAKLLITVPQGSKAFERRFETALTRLYKASLSDDNEKAEQSFIAVKNLLESTQRGGQIRETLFEPVAELAEWCNVQDIRGLKQRSQQLFDIQSKRGNVSIDEQNRLRFKKVSDSIDQNDLLELMNLHQCIQSLDAHVSQNPVYGQLPPDFARNFPAQAPDPVNYGRLPDVVHSGQEAGRTVDTHQTPRSNVRFHRGQQIVPIY